MAFSRLSAYANSQEVKTHTHTLEDVMKGLIIRTGELKKTLMSLCIVVLHQHRHHHFSAHGAAGGSRSLGAHQLYPRCMCGLQANMLACFYLLLLPVLLSRAAGRTMGSFVPVCVRCDEPGALGRTHNTAHFCHSLCWSREFSFFEFIGGWLTTHEHISANHFTNADQMDFFFFFPFYKQKFFGCYKKTDEARGRGQTQEAYLGVSS